jgi:hypothetical protein
MEDFTRSRDVPLIRSSWWNTLLYKHQHLPGSAIEKKRINDFEKEKAKRQKYKESVAESKTNAPPADTSAIMRVLPVVKNTVPSSGMTFAESTELKRQRRAVPTFALRDTVTHSRSKFESAITLIESNITRYLDTQVESDFFKSAEELATMIHNHKRNIASLIKIVESHTLGALDAEIDRMKTLQTTLKRKKKGLSILRTQKSSSSTSPAMKIRDLESEIQSCEERINTGKKILAEAISKHQSNASLDEAREFISSL